METTKAEGEELVQTKMRREITSLEDDELWAEFEQEGIDRILSGEIKPKTLITNYGFPSSRFPQRGPLIAKEMRAVIPNSKQIRWEWGLPTSFKELIRIGKERGCTSLVLARTNCFAQDEICIVSLLNGAAAYFRVLNLIPREDRPDQPRPTRRGYPEVQMARFTSPASVGTARLKQSLFPKVTHACRRNVVLFHNHTGFSHPYGRKENDTIIYRHEWLHVEKAAVEGEKPIVTRKEGGPRFKLVLSDVKKVALDTTGSEKRICMPPARPHFEDAFLWAPSRDG